MHINKNRIIITTPLFYPSGKPHIGHAYTFIISDSIARIYKNLKHNVTVITGTDNHGQKIYNLSVKNNLSPKNYLKPFVDQFKSLKSTLNIDWNFFIETSDEDNKKNVQQIFKVLLEKNLIYESQWKSKYCVSCEEDYSINLISCNLNHDLITKNEPSHFLKVKSQSKWLINYYNDNPLFLFPITRFKELKNNFLDNVQDLSITRNKLTWGVNVPNDENRTIYVWFDALCNYLSANNWPDKNDNSTKIIQVIGKEIVRFHGIYWPIILNNIDLKLPDKILAHGWIIMNKQKMSKSIGNTICPFKLLTWYPIDALRLFFLQHSPAVDVNISLKSLYDVYHKFIVNEYVNLVHRFQGLFKKAKRTYVNKENEWNSILIKEYESYLELAYTENISSIIFDAQLIIKKANKIIQDEKPWTLEVNSSKFNDLLIFIYKLIRWVTWTLNPIIPNITSKIMNSFQWNNLSFEDLDPLLPVELLNCDNPVEFLPKHSLESWQKQYVSSFKEKD